MPDSTAPGDAAGPVNVGGPVIAGGPGVSGRSWAWRPADDHVTTAIMRQHGLPELAARALAARGVSVEAVGDFLSPRLRASMPDPACLMDMDRATARLARALEAGEPIAVWADYDVDGATSAALLLRYLAARGAAGTVLHVPDRLADGYGLNGRGLERLAADGVGLVIAVDCGTNDTGPAAAAAAAGLDLMVIDHHPGAAPVPDGILALVNPNRADEDPQTRHRLGALAACGVTFLVLVALDRRLRQEGAGPGPDLLELLDLVALGTVCDVVPLTGLNRAFVAQGLKVLARGGNSGVAALAAEAGVAGPADAWHLGFVLGPRINAGGRLGRADLGARLLACQDPNAAGEMAAVLDTWNTERKALEAAVLDDALAQITAACGPDTRPDGVVAVAGDGWHPGVVGIVAGRLKERFQRPALVVGWDGAAGSGSLRSVPGFDIGAAVAAAQSAGHVSSGGGHPMAAGCRVERSRFADLVAMLEQAFRAPGDTAVPRLEIDGAVAPAGLGEALVDLLDGLGPHGAGNPQPRLMVANCRIEGAQVVGGRHVRARLAGAGRAVSVIAFRAAGDTLGRLLLDRAGAPVDLVGSVKRNVWQGRTRIDLVVEDARVVWS